MNDSRPQIARLLRATWVLPLLVVLLSLFLNLYRIDYQSLWYDETFSYLTAKLPVREMTFALIEDFVHPPLHYYLLHFWFDLLGPSALHARLLAAAFATLAVWMTVLLGERLFGRRTGLLGGTLLAVSQLGVMYAQEARPYSQALFLVVCTCYFFVRNLQEKTAWTWWGTVLSATLMLYTHYMTSFAAVVLFLFAIASRKHFQVPWRRIAMALVLLTAFLSIWLTSGVLENALESPKTIRQQPAWFAVDRGTPLRALNQLNNGNVDGVLQTAPRWTFPVGALLFTLPALIALGPLFSKSFPQMEPAEDRRMLLLLGLLTVFPILAAIGLGAFGIQYDVRYVLYSLVPYYLLVARGMMAIRPGRLRFAFVFIAILYSAFSLRAVYFIPYKENYRDALAILAKEYRAGDCCAFLPFSEIPGQWYVYERNLPALRRIGIPLVVANPSVCNRLWVVSYSRIPDARRIAAQASEELNRTHVTVRHDHSYWVDLSLHLPRTKQQLTSEPPTAPRERD